jgi:hypothetical protein
MLFVYYYQRCASQDVFFASGGGVENGEGMLRYNVWVDWD